MITEVSSLTKGGESLNLDLFDPWSSGIAVKEITGLGPVKTELSLERYALIDGAFLKGRGWGLGMGLSPTSPAGKTFRLNAARSITTSQSGSRCPSAWLLIRWPSSPA